MWLSYLPFTTVQSRFDLATAENPDIQSKTSRASGWFASAWSILEGLASLLAIATEVSGQVSVLARVASSQPENSKLFVLLCVARPLAMFVFDKHRTESKLV